MQVVLAPLRALTSPSFYAGTFLGTYVVYTLHDAVSTTRANQVALLGTFCPKRSETSTADPAVTQQRRRINILESSRTEYGPRWNDAVMACHAKIQGLFF